MYRYLVQAQGDGWIWRCAIEDTNPVRAFRQAQESFKTLWLDADSGHLSIKADELRNVSWSIDGAQCMDLNGQVVLLTHRPLHFPDYDPQELRSTSVAPPVPPIHPN